jgi:hypothetical protein
MDSQWENRVEKTGDEAKTRFPKNYTTHNHVNISRQPAHANGNKDYGT